MPSPLDRVMLKQKVKQVVCRHQWSPAPANVIGDRVTRLWTHDEECQKCGAGR